MVIYLILESLGSWGCVVSASHASLLVIVWTHRLVWSVWPVCLSSSLWSLRLLSFVVSVSALTIRHVSLIIFLGSRISITCTVRGPLCRITGFSSLDFSRVSIHEQHRENTCQPWFFRRSVNHWRKPIGSCISVWIQFASSSTPFPSPPFANNAVVWTHHTRSSKPSYIWCIRRIWPDWIRQYLYCRYRCRSRLQRYLRSTDDALGIRSYGVDFQLTKLMEISSQWSLMASRSGMMVVSPHYMAQYRFSIGPRSGRQAQSDRLWDRRILQLGPNWSWQQLHKDHLHSEWNHTVCGILFPSLVAPHTL